MTTPTLLVVDDEPRIRRVLELALAELEYRVLLAASGAEARQRLEEDAVDLVLLDLQLPDTTGLEVLARLRADRSDVPVILMTAFGTVETAVQAMKLGAFDYVVKPFAVDEIDALARRALSERRAAREIAYFRETEATSFEGIIAASPAMHHVVASIEQVAPAPSTVLITGETGVGKELVARAIHARSPRAGGLFVAVNCAAIPSELLEAELFGVTKGAYTGAVADRAGKFELADGGTLFLDEIGDMPASMQPKLLRVLQEGTVERLGSSAVRRVDVRVVAATHRNLPELVDQGAFRADLYYRLAVVPIHVPPLRERPEDIAPLAGHLVERFGRRLGRRAHLTDTVVRALEAYPWPGNVRELGNILERAVLLSPGDLIVGADLPAAGSILAARVSGGAGAAPGAGASATPAVAGPATSPAPPAAVTTLRDAVEDAERRAIAAALHRTGDNKTRAADLLGVSVRTLWYKLEKLGLERRTG